MAVTPQPRCLHGVIVLVILLFQLMLTVLRNGRQEELETKVELNQQSSVTETNINSYKIT